MGTSAIVECRCWEDGLVGAPPIGVSRDLGRLAPLDRTASIERRIAFDRWRSSACAHDDMIASFEPVGTALDIQSFLDAFLEVDPSGVEFGHVLTNLRANGEGVIASDDVESAAAQLEAMALVTREWTRPRLVDASTGAVISAPTVGLGNVVFFDGARGVRMSLEERSMVVTFRDGGRTVLGSRATQRFDEAAGEFIYRGGGSTVRSMFGLADAAGGDVTIEVAEETFTVERFEPQLIALRRSFAVARHLDHPVAFE